MLLLSPLFLFFFFNDTATTEIYTLSLHDALPISCLARIRPAWVLESCFRSPNGAPAARSLLRPYQKPLRRVSQATAISPSPAPPRAGHRPAAAAAPRPAPPARGLSAPGAPHAARAPCPARIRVAA